MDAEKIRNLTGDELLLQQRDLNDQLFRLKFQLKMGQTESLKKIRGLRKDVARVKTIMREKELGIVHKSEPASAQAAAAPAKPAKKAAARAKRGGPPTRRGAGAPQKREKKAPHNPRRKKSRGQAGEEIRESRQFQKREKVNGRNNNPAAHEPPRYQDRPRGFQQDGQDHCGPGHHEEGPSALPASGGQGKEVLCAR